jgi:molybdenum cofactor biosynthesis protein B
MGHREHKEKAPKAIAFAVATVSDTRGMEDDAGGRLIADLVVRSGHVLAGRFLVRDDLGEITSLVAELLEREDIDLVVLTGGTGIAVRDVTIEAVSPFIEKEIDGFGELFRYLGFLDIGSAAMLSRATAGVARGKIIFSLPGSVDAIVLAMERLILPEAGHMVMEARK